MTTLIEQQAHTLNTREFLSGFLESLVRDGIPDGFFSWLLGVEDKVWNNVSSLLEPLLERMLFPEVKVSRVHYLSVDATGNGSSTLSALLIVPDTPVGTATMPILGFQHGTIINRDGAPSQFDPANPVATIEAVLGILLASLNGYVVAMADYPGLGDDNQNIQPYVSEAPLAKSVIDLLLATKEHVADRWDQTIYLTGYSQGGYVTMAAAKAIAEDLQLQQALPLKATAPCAGPYSLSNVMRFLMLREENFKDGGHFVLMALRGFNATYGDSFGDGIFTKEGALHPDYHHLWDLADGTHTSDVVNAAMPDIPRHCFSARILMEMETEGSSVMQTLLNNNILEWQPSAPLHLYHSPSDDIVPFHNSTLAIEAVQKVDKTVALSPSFYTPIGTLVHIEAAIPNLMNAYAWLNTFRNYNKCYLAAGEFLLPGEDLFSSNRDFCLRLQHDNNLVFYKMANIRELWRAAIPKLENPLAIVFMNPNGQLIAADDQNQTVWSSHTDGNPGAKLQITETGNLDILSATGALLQRLV